MKRDKNGVVRMTTRTVLVSAIVSGIGLPVIVGAMGQTPTAVDRLRFDVVSIKENASGQFESFAYPYAATGRLRLVNQTAMQMIRQAYGVWDYQVVGGPDWLERVRYDVEAKADGPTTRDGLMRRLRSLLEDEFKLVTRLENRDGALLQLVRVRSGKTGPNLKAAQPEDAQLYPVGGKVGGLRGRAATMADFAATLSNVEHRLVVDKTELSGSYNFELDYAAERRVPPPGVPADKLPPPNDDLPPLSTALEQQLGLRLESTRGPVPILVIVSAERPRVEGTASRAEPLR